MAVGNGIPEEAKGLAAVVLAYSFINATAAITVVVMYFRQGDRWGSTLRAYGFSCRSYTHVC